MPPGSMILFLLLCLGLLASSCAHAPETRAGRAYGAVASWYGPGFNGRRTASGEVFDQDRLTAAHRTYAFGTRLKLTNPQTGRSCVVVVNDRGPFVSGVDIDISRGASRAIGRLDTGPVILEELGRDTSYIGAIHTGRISGKGVLRVQVGSFTDEDNAGRLKEGLDIGYDNVRITRAEVGGRTVYKVQVGSFTDKPDAYRTARRLADEGYETWITRE